MSQKAKASSMKLMAQEADTSNAHGPNWTLEELEDFIYIWSEERIIDRIPSWTFVANISTRLGQEEVAAVLPESKTMSMSQLYADRSLLPDDHDWQEEPLVYGDGFTKCMVIDLVPLSPVPWTTTDNKVEEVEGQEETHMADTSSTTTEIQEHVSPGKTQTENYS
ncbi:hypothetical protein Y1Q_0020338 [Alligator mississippiensis]|uniref:Uncharacterized protein n=1 Tax=Alligator mississippiensis TaxID=8496 RepID=A0A151N775_ALLMI|nr:hypothetical protein Y1Q_0020338 [Alligator mississippiensis]